MKRCFVSFATFFVFLVIFTAFMPITEAVYYKRLEYAGFSCNAGQTLAVGDIVCIKDSDGEAYKADANDSNLRPAVGVVATASTNGNPVRIVTIGLFSGWSSLGEGAAAYLSETAGAVTQTAPTYAQKIATAISTTEYYFEFDQTTNNITTLGTITSNVTLDDGSGASPSFTLTDGTDETCVLSKADAGYTSITTVAGDGIQVTTGNLKVGNGTPGTASMDGEDLYCEGQSEFDGAMTADGAITANSTITAVGNVTLDDGTGASPSLTLQDGTDETVAFSKVDAGYMTITTVAGDGVQVLTGNLKIGNGTPGITVDGEDLYCEGDSEFVGTMTLDDGSGASPSIIFKDATDETATFSKADAGYLSITTVAGDGVQISTGNLKIGNGTPGQTIDGEDLYCEGISEFANNMTIDDGVEASPSVTFIDATDETAVLNKADAGNLSVTTVAGDGFQVLTGNLFVGNGTPVQTINGEDLYCEGLVEIAGALYPSGGMIYEGTDNGFETTIAFTDPVNDATLTLPNWTGDVPVIVNTDYADYAAVNQTTDGTSVTVPDAVLVAGKSLRFKLAGTCTGANANKSIILYIDDAAIVTLSTDAGTDVGDWTAEFILMASGSATQRVTGNLIMAAAAIVTTDYATDTTNFSDGGTTTVKTQVISGNAGDTITQTMCIVEFLP